MKKVAIIALVVLVGLILTSSVYAWRGGYGMDYRKGADVETVKKFQKETLSIRDELMTKKLELRNEFSKSVPDNDRITTLRKEIIDLEAKIQSVADKYEIPGAGPFGRMKGRGMMRQERVKERCCCPHN